MQLREKFRRLQAMPHPDLVRLASQHSDFENFKHWNPDLPQAKLARFALEVKLEPPQTGPLTQARAAFIALYAQDVAAFPDCYRAEVCANPRQHAEHLIDGLTVAEIRQFTNDLRREMRRVKQLTGRS